MPLEATVEFILDNLAVGSVQDTRNPPPDITALLCVAEELDLPSEGRIYHKVPIADMRPIPAEQLREAVWWLMENLEGNRVMVFCNGGVGRSPSVVIAYLCCVIGLGFGEAVEFAAVKKPYMSTLPELITSIDQIRSAPWKSATSS
jgi:protein-tyrosine phosphatase